MPRRRRLGAACRVRAAAPRSKSIVWPLPGGYAFFAPSESLRKAGNSPSARLRATNAWRQPPGLELAVGDCLRHSESSDYSPVFLIPSLCKPTNNGAMATYPTTHESTRAAHHPARPGRWATLSALGVVFGDLGTSPLYARQTVVQATGGQFTSQSALGVLSLIVWTLIVTISIKYCLFVMRADNSGEGGILALMSLIGANGFTRGFKLLTGMGLLGAALIYGDGVITPAISVLSAIGGVNVVTSPFKPFVMPMAAALLLCLFSAQRFGTEKIGRAFGPVMLLWFIVIAVLGLVSIARHPAVIAALDPRYAIRFMICSGST